MHSFDNQTTTFDAENTVHAALPPQTIGSDQTLSQVPTVHRLLEHGQDDDNEEANNNARNHNMNDGGPTVNYQ